MKKAGIILLAICLMISLTACAASKQKKVEQGAEKRKTK